MAEDWYVNPAARDWTAPGAASSPRPFHESHPDYEPTPLVEVPTLAEELGVAQVWVKDESARLGLPSFKVLGASWAATQVLARNPGAMLVTATEGNHGRALARAAKEQGSAATVFVPDSTLRSTEELIAAEGAEVVRVDGDYDAAVGAAASFAHADEDRELVQDTAWPGYEQVPEWIVAGYSTLLTEIDRALETVPDLVVVPVGVGSLAQAVVTHYRQPGTDHPAVLAVEPDAAASLLASLRAGHSVQVTTGPTVMAGLRCGTVSSAALPVLARGCDAVVTVTDEEALQASDDLGRLGLTSGPSGAAPLAGARAVLGRPERRAALQLPDEPVVVLLSTEGREG